MGLYLLSIYLLIYICTSLLCLSVFIHVCYVYLSICASLSPPVYVSICLPHVCLSTLKPSSQPIYLFLPHSLFTYRFLMPTSLIIVNDIFAYLCGRAFGRHRLIGVSPKKTVEGFIGAIFFTCIFTFFVTSLLQYHDQSLFLTLTHTYYSFHVFWLLSDG